MDEEYTVLNYIGAKLKAQQLKGHYDVMTVDLNGKSTTLYFDAAIPLKVMADQLDAGKNKR